MHSKIGWKNVLSNSDALASSDPKMLKKAEEVEKLFAQQGQWVTNQNNSMIQLNDRFEHLIFVLKDEIEREHRRENRILEAGVTTQSNNGHVNMAVSTASSVDEIITAIKQKTKVEDIKIWVERLEAVDRIILTLQQYDFVSGLDEVDFLLFMMHKWKKQCQENIQKHSHRHHHHQHQKQIVSPSDSILSSGNEDDESIDESTNNKLAISKLKKKKNAAVVGNMNPYEATFIHLTDNNKKSNKLLKNNNDNNNNSKDNNFNNNNNMDFNANLIGNDTTAVVNKQKKNSSSISNLILKAVTIAGLNADGRSDINPFANIGNDKRHTLPVINEDSSVINNNNNTDLINNNEPLKNNNMKLSRSNSSVSISYSNSEYSQSTILSDNSNNKKFNKNNENFILNTELIEKKIKLNQREQDKVDMKIAKRTFR